MENCTDKFLKHSERVGARFAEHNAGMSYGLYSARSSMSERRSDAWTISLLGFGRGGERRIAS